MSEGRERPGRERSGRFAKTLAGAERDRDACRLRERGLTYQQISDQLGYGSEGNARRAVKECLAAVQGEAGEAVKRFELGRLDEMHRHVLAVLERHHVTVSNGRVVRDDDGQPILDDGPVLAAVDRLLRIQERRARLLGLDAPARSRVEIIDDDVARQLVEQLEAELADLAGEDDEAETPEG